LFDDREGLATTVKLRGGGDTGSIESLLRQLLRTQADATAETEEYNQDRTGVAAAATVEWHLD